MSKHTDLLSTNVCYSLNSKHAVIPNEEELNKLLFDTFEICEHKPRYAVACAKTHNIFTNSVGKELLFKNIKKLKKAEGFLIIAGIDYLVLTCFSQQESKDGR